MKAKHFLIIGAVIIVALAGLLLFYPSRPQTTLPTPTPSASPIAAENDQAHTFTNSDTGKSISVVFDNQNNTAILNGLEYLDVTFNLAMSASGARYTNDELRLVLWNKGNDITLSKGDTTLFTGSTTE